jgi:hypothetical protein
MAAVASVIAGGAAIVAGMGLRRVWPPTEPRRILAAISLAAVGAAVFLVWISGLVVPIHESPPIFENGVLLEEADIYVECDDKAVLEGLGIVVFGVALAAAAAGRAVRGRRESATGVGPFVTAALVLAAASWILLLAPPGGCAEAHL